MTGPRAKPRVGRQVRLGLHTDRFVKAIRFARISRKVALVRPQQNVLGKKDLKIIEPAKNFKNSPSIKLQKVGPIYFSARCLLFAILWASRPGEIPIFMPLT